MPLSRLAGIGSAGSSGRFPMRSRASGWRGRRARSRRRGGESRRSRRGILPSSARPPSCPASRGQAAPRCSTASPPNGCRYGFWSPWHLVEPRHRIERTRAVCDFASVGVPGDFVTGATPVEGIRPETWRARPFRRSLATGRRKCAPFSAYSYRSSGPAAGPVGPSSRSPTRSRPGGGSRGRAPRTRGRGSSPGPRTRPADAVSSRSVRRRSSFPRKSRPEEEPARVPVERVFADPFAVVDRAAVERAPGSRPGPSPGSAEAEAGERRRAAPRRCRRARLGSRSSGGGPRPPATAGTTAQGQGGTGAPCRFAANHDASPGGTRIRCSVRAFARPARARA